MQPDRSPRPGSAVPGVSNIAPAQRVPSVQESSPDLVGASFTPQIATPPYSVNELQRAADRLNCSPHRTEIMNRLEEASHPLPSSLADDIALAQTRFESMSPEAQLEIVQRFFTPAIMERAAWAIPGCPFVSVSSPSIPAETQNFMKGMVEEILTVGTLPHAMSVGAITALGMSVPRYKAHMVRHLTLLTGAVTIGAVVCGALWAAGAVLATGACLIRGLRRQPDLHGEFAAGCLLECMDADQVIRGTGDTVPTLTKTVESYFNDPSIPQTYHNTLQSEGFLAARTLRIFGYSPLDIFSGFQASSSLSPQKQPHHGPSSIVTNSPGGLAHATSHNCDHQSHRG